MSNDTYWSCWSSGTTSSMPGPSIYTGTAGTCYPLSPATTYDHPNFIPIPLNPYIITYPGSTPYIITYPATSPLGPLKFDYDWSPKPAKKILRKPLRMIRIREDA